MWGNIRGYPNYAISDDGVVKNRSGKILSQYKDKDGYLTVSLCKNAKPKTFRVHRLVAIAFIPNINQLGTVDHINGEKTDNRVSNLQWMSPRDNLSKYLNEVGKIIHKNPKRRNRGMKRGEAKRIKVNQFTKDGKFVNTYESFMEAERQTGVRSGGISACVNKHKPSAGGYVWEKATNSQTVPGMGDWGER